MSMEQKKRMKKLPRLLWHGKWAYLLWPLGFTAVFAPMGYYEMYVNLSAQLELGDSASTTITALLVIPTAASVFFLTVALVSVMYDKRSRHMKIKDYFKQVSIEAASTVSLFILLIFSYCGYAYHYRFIEEHISSALWYLEPYILMVSFCIGRQIRLRRQG